MEKRMNAKYTEIYVSYFLHFFNNILRKIENVLFMFSCVSQ